MHYGKLSAKIQKAQNDNALSLAKSEMQDDYNLELNHLQKQMKALQIGLNQLEQTKTSLEELIALKEHELAPFPTAEDEPHC